MKTKFFLLCSVLVCSAILSLAQVKVDNTGSLTIIKNNVQQRSAGVYSRSLAGSVYSGYGIMPSERIGVFGEAYGSGNTSVHHIGVLGHANTEAAPNCAFAIGVLGVISRSNNRIAIAGLTNGRSIALPNGGHYAGYFDGDVKVNGYFSATTISQTSDERLKKNILSLGSEKVLNKLMLLKPIEYNFKQVDIEVDSVNSKGESIKFTVKRYNEKSQEFQKKHYGLLAQELQKVYPNLVYDDGDGYLAVNYIELVPILLQAIQEQQIAIEELQRRQSSSNIVGTKGISVIGSSLPAEQPALLFQNAPNPFSERTEISYYLPENVQKASLYVYDMNGRQMLQIPLSQKGNASVIVAGNQLQAGMYLYALIADGNEIDTKRMILTK